MTLAIVIPPVDYREMRVGKVLSSWDGGRQCVERCPHCGRASKRHLTGVNAVWWIHETVDGVATLACKDGR